MTADGPGAAGGAGPGLTFPFAAETGQPLEVADGIWWLRLPLPFPPGHVNAVVLDDGDGWTIVDPGLSHPATAAIWDAALAGPFAGHPVTRVIVTHHHPDHVGLAARFVGTGAALWMTRTAWLYARMMTLDLQDRTPPETLAFLRAAGMPADRLAARAADRPFNFADVVLPLPLGFHRLDAGMTLRAGGRDWVVRLGQGHAPDHATLWSVDGTLVIGGDQVLPGISPNLGVYATEPGADPVGDWIASCRALAAHATDTQLVLPGHKLPYRGLPLRLAQMIANHDAALDRLRAALTQPLTAVECFGAIYGRPIGDGEYGLALAEAVGHLNHLLRVGQARRQMGPDGAWRWTGLR
jgi:glyoxylase-like metal-dependent hydrolase (beta-lactamase superfamily II)